MLQRHLKYYVYLTLLSLFLYLPGIANLPIVDRDSPHFAQASKQMLETHDYWQINFQAAPRHLKPPGIYWLHVLAVKIFSPHNINRLWPYRIPGVLAAWLTVLFTFAFTRRHYSDRIAFTAASLLAISFLLVLETHLIVTDVVLLLSMILMQGALWQIYIAEKTKTYLAPYWALLFWCAMAFGVLIKGLTPLIAVLTLLFLLFADKDKSWFKSIKFQWGIPLLILLTLAWLLPISFAGHSNYLMDMIRGDVVPKVIGGQQSHGMPPGYFALLYPLSAWPSSLFFWLGIAYAIKQWHRPQERFLLTWIIAVWLFFELIPTKLPEYLLPIYPACSILMANGILNDTMATVSRKWRIWLQAYGLIWLAYSLTLGFFSLFLALYLQHKILWSAMTAALVITIGAVLSAILYWRRALIQAFNLSILLAILSYGLIYHFELPKLSNIWLSEQVALLLQNKLSDQDPLLAIGYQEPSLVFLLGTHQVEFANLPMDPVSAQGQWLLVEQKQLATVLQYAAVKKYSLQQHAVVHGYNYSNGKWVTLYLYQLTKE